MKSYLDMKWTLAYATPEQFGANQEFTRVVLEKLLEDHALSSKKHQSGHQTKIES